MPLVARVTLIHPDGSRKVTVDGGFAHTGSYTAAKIPLERAPGWEQAGMDVVAAYADGSVAAAFTALHMDSDPVGAD